MKKSEMLGKIWNILYSKTDLESDGLKLLSEEILEIIEQNGMLPPINDQEYHHMDNGDRKTVNAAMRYFTWEK